MWTFKTAGLALLLALGLGISSCGETDDFPYEDYEIWSGPMITFSKADGADPTAAENQDRITDRVWITRGNNGGQIFNAVREAEDDKNVSPAGTLWAIGTTADFENLNFTEFRSTIRPQEVVGRNLVMVLLDDQVAIDVTFTRWPGNRAGGFTYERSTP